MPLSVPATAPASRLLRLAVVLAAVTVLGACHTFPDDPNAQRWPSEPSQPALTFVSGRVYLQGTLTPVQGVTVSSANFSTITDASGYYALDGQRTIQTLVVGIKDGFDTTRVGIQLPGGNVTFNFSMRPR